MEDSVYHRPVLQTEVVKLLKPKPGSLIVDATCGGGGHTQALLQSGADVLALDGDRGHPPLVDRLKEVAEGDLGLAGLLLGHDRPQQEAHQQEEQPEAEIAGDGVQAHTTDTGTL